MGTASAYRPLIGHLLLILPSDRLMLTSEYMRAGECRIVLIGLFESNSNKRLELDLRHSETPGLLMQLLYLATNTPFYRS